MLPAHAATSGEDCNNPSAKLTIEYDPTPVQGGGELTITTTVTNDGDVSLEVTFDSSSTPFVTVTRVNNDFPTTLNPGESGKIVDSGTSVPCREPGPYDALFKFTIESCAGEEELALTQEVACET